VKNAPPNAPTERFRDIAQRYMWRPEFEGRELTGPNDTGVDGETLFHLVVADGSVDDISFLINMGGDVNRPGDIGNTPIHYAAMHGRPEVIKLLVDAGADLDAQNELGDTAMSWAESCERWETLAMLRQLKSSAD
jgi:ankyrin repeat protein